MSSMNIFDLTGRTALITGGAGHLGSAMSEALAAYGASVIIASRDGDRCAALASELSGKFGTPCEGIRLDISNTESVKEELEVLMSVHGRLDVLVNNAAYSVAGYFEDLDEETWTRAIDGTVNATFRMCSAVIPHMIQQGGGSIVNIASMYGIVSPRPSLYRGEVRFNNPAPYGAGKAGVIQLTRYLAGYYGPKGIRCNCISPGPFPSSSVQETTWFADNLAASTMLGRIGKPRELVGSLLLLASDAGSYITGQNIVVDGGWTAW